MIVPGIGRVKTKRKPPEGQNKRGRKKGSGTKVPRVDVKKLSEEEQGKRHAFILSNLGLELYFSRSLIYKYRWVPPKDIRGYATEGLIEAIDRFNPKMGFSLSTYAKKWIMSTVHRRVTEYEQGIRLPENKVAELATMGRELFEERASYSNLPFQSQSLNKPLLDGKGEGGWTLADTISSSTETESGVHNLHTQRKIASAIKELRKCLSDNEYYVLARISGFIESDSDGEDGATFAAVGRELGYRSRETTRVSFERARAKAAKFLRNRGFTPETCFL